MALRFYNTLTRSLETFRPLDPPNVGVYACGPTVYQLPHIGNYRTFLFNDLLHRYLEWKGFQVKFVMNVTDVDDKTIAGAMERGVSLGDFTSPVIEAFHEDLRRMGVLAADVYPRATHHIQEMVALVERLLERGHAYEVDGSVYFDISSFRGYGKLSGIDLGAVRATDRIRSRTAADEYAKDDARDFALWKAAREEDRGVGAVWSTPWGEGRPGWHLECSAMSMAELGRTFDVHTGGEDLVFPHHEDEIAQSEGATGRPFVRYWLHVKHLLMDGEKMSKSLGNVYTLRDLLDQGHDAASVRYLLLSAHYRKELNFTVQGLDDARSALRRLLDFEDRLGRTASDDDAPATTLPDLAATLVDRFEEALDDDLNMPAGLGTLFTFVREANAVLDRTAAVRPGELDAARDALSRVNRVLGCLDLARQAASEVDEDLAAWVEARLQERRDARARRDFATADRIRDELAERGIVVEDTPGETRWHKA